ncbi:hypothetical protein H5410_039146 [Solanum commersonii]|uniref:Uncharacterized protein n=1 Tax=Solanum commersonii TaxID=4109 RepID=A0A9J5YCK4_SOLCO|nr:hypothetical protein H5410_039146 [Solanum commersonii]
MNSSAAAGSVAVNAPLLYTFRPSVVSETRRDSLRRSFLGSIRHWLYAYVGCSAFLWLSIGEDDVSVDNPCACA